MTDVQDPTTDIQDDEDLFVAPPTLPAGTYPAIITKVARVTIETAEGPKDLVRWSVTATDIDGQDVETDALSSLNFGQRSKARRWAAAILGQDVQSIRARDLEGKPILAVLVEDDQGFVKLADIVAPVRQPAGKHK